MNTVTMKRFRRLCRSSIRADRSWVLRVNHEIADEAALVVSEGWPSEAGQESRREFIRVSRVRMKAHFRDSRPQMSPMMWWLLWQVAKMVLARLIKKYWGSDEVLPELYVSS